VRGDAFPDRLCFVREREGGLPEADVAQTRKPWGSNSRKIRSPGVASKGKRVTVTRRCLKSPNLPKKRSGKKEGDGRTRGERREGRGKGGSFFAMTIKMTDRGDG